MSTGHRLDYRFIVISQERLKIEVRLLLSANRKSYMPRQLAQQRMTLSDLEWPFHASRIISAIVEFLVTTCEMNAAVRICLCVCLSVCLSVSVCPICALTFENLT